ncbi:MAG: hypothetical protein Q8Q08_04480 [Candidatus Omnitrophota bacterium]|nr:hypothetical protein [Candidatus Omnitrophota bacterium]MDZ4242576.1 hypothetical protein [Candidatus Omnitrophota bacterium]
MALGREGEAVEQRPLSGSHSNVLAFALGFCSLTAQVVMLRELSAVFFGNEIAYAVILAAWLFWIAVGSYAGSLCPPHLSLPGLVIAQVAAWALLPATVLAGRFLKVMLNVPSGAVIGIVPMAIASFAVLAPVPFVFGAIFSLLVRSAALQSRTEERAAARIYFWESLGAASGGFFFHFVLVHVLAPLTVAGLAGWLGLAAACGVLMAWWAPKRFLFVLFLLGAFVPILCLDAVETWSRRAQWPGMQLVASVESPYGHLSLIRREDTFSVYENGTLAFTTGDDLTAETSVHYAMLSHASPRKVLLAGNGLNGSLREILRHPVEHVDYVELDPKMIGLGRAYFPDEAVRPLADPRVNAVAADARRFIKQKGRGRITQGYDVVIVNLGDPVSAMTNRYYTVEFFREVQRLMYPGSLLSLRLTSSENYLGPSQREYLRSIHSTLKQVFPQVQSIPGDTHIFLAGNSKTLFADPATLSGREAERRLGLKFVNGHYLPFVMSPDRMSRVQKDLSVEGRINSDLCPVAYYYNMVLWSLQNDPWAAKVASALRGIPATAFLIFPLLVFLLGLRPPRRGSLSDLRLPVGVAGFSLIVSQVLLLIAFQAIYGYAYERIGAMMGAFMLGLAAGSALVLQSSVWPPGRVGRMYIFCQTGLGIFLLSLPVFLGVFQKEAGGEEILAAVFLVLPALAGLAGGIIYPLAVRLHAGGNDDSAGPLYAADTWGASAGALVTGALLVPLYGIPAVSFLAAALNFAVCVPLLTGLRQPASVSPGR